MGRMLIDAHTHLFPVEVRRDHMAFAARDRQLSLLYSGDDVRMAGRKDLVFELDKHGIGFAVAYGFPWRDIELARRHNDYLLEAAELAGGRLIPAACVHPLSPGATKEADRALSAGAGVLGEVAMYRRDITPDTLDALLDLAYVCACHDKPLCLHVNEPVGHQYPGKAPMTLRGLYSFLEESQGVKIILAHLGGGIFFYNLLKKDIAGLLENVYIDTAAIPYLYKPKALKLACDLLGPEHVMMGTDYPLLPWTRYMRFVERAGLDKEEIEWIEGRSAASLFGIEDRQERPEGNSDGRFLQVPG